ncbi:MAG: peptidoglycan DD-metalloendopeptidase family protein [Myxococcota bacterium]
MTFALAAALLLSPRAALEETQRDAATLAERVAEREDLLRRRVATLYRLGRGGLARSLAGARNAADLSQKVEAARRIVRRDVEELGELRRERDDLVRMRAELLARLERLEIGRATASPLGPRRGRLRPPVAGPPPRPLLSGLLFRTKRRSPVRAIGPGRVVHSGPIPGFGVVVLVDHGGGIASLYAQLGAAAVAEEQTVGDGGVVGRVADRALYFELRRDSEVIAASSWFRRR